jgi:iron complex outermembrane receptor protein
MRTNSYAAYGQLTYDLTETLSVIGGLRWTHEKKSVEGRTQNGVAGTTYAPIDASTSAEAWTPKVGLNWQATPTVLAYVSASRGFQAGGFNYLAVVNPVAYQTPFRPQTVWAYEAGLKTQFWDRRGRFNVALYRNDFKDIQTNVLVASGSSLTQNAGTARVQGVEAELSVTPITGLNIFGTASYSDGKYLKLNPASDAARAGAKEIPDVPEWQLSAGFNGSAPTPRGDVLYGADWSYVSHKYLGATNAPITRMPGFNLVNAFVGFRPLGSKFEARVSVSNLLKEHYYVYGNVLGAYGIRSPGEPRMVKLSVNYSY